MNPLFDCLCIAQGDAPGEGARHLARSHSPEAAGSYGGPREAARSDFIPEQTPFQAPFQAPAPMPPSSSLPASGSHLRANQPQAGSGPVLGQPPMESEWGWVLGGAPAGGPAQSLPRKLPGVAASEARSVTAAAVGPVVAAGIGSAPAAAVLSTPAAASVAGEGSVGGIPESVRQELESRRQESERLREQCTCPITLVSPKKQSP